MKQKDLDQIRAVIRHVVEDRKVWALLPKYIQKAAMAQFIRTETSSRIGNSDD